MKKNLKIFGQLSAVVGCAMLFVAIGAVLSIGTNSLFKKMAYEKMSRMVEKGAVIYLDGNEVDLDSVNFVNYDVCVKDGNIFLSGK